MLIIFTDIVNINSCILKINFEFWNKYLIVLLLFFIGVYNVIDIRNLNRDARWKDRLPLNSVC